MDINDLLPLVIVFVILGVALSIGASIIDSLHQDACTDAGETWIAIGTSQPSGYIGGNNPVTGGFWGCCGTTDGADNCTAWDTDDARINATVNSNKAIDELASWQDTLALVIIAAVIIGVLIGALYVKLGKGSI